MMDEREAFYDWLAHPDSRKLDPTSVSAWAWEARRVARRVAAPEHIADASKMMAAPSAEPFGWIADHRVGGVKSAHTFLPSPELADSWSKSPNVRSVTAVYTADAIAAEVEKAVAAERERIAKHFDGSDSFIYRSEVAAAIRGKG